MKINVTMKKQKMSDDARLQALVEQWKEINSFINKLDTETWVVFTILGFFMVLLLNLLMAT